MIRRDIGAGQKVLIETRKRIALSIIAITGDFDSSHFQAEAARDGHSVEHIRVPKSYVDIKYLISRADCYVLGGPEYLRGELLQLATNLRLVSVMGVGTPSFVDLDAATRAGIKVINVPGLNSESVAEFAIGQIIVHRCSFFRSVNGVTRGDLWLQESYRRLKDLQIGILGAGAVGRQVVRMLHLLGIKCLYSGRERKREVESEFGAQFLPLEQLLEASDIVSVHVPFSLETKHLLKERELRLIGRSGSLLNFSNPRLICPEALRNVLIRGELGSAFFDGYYREWAENGGVTDDVFGLLDLGLEKFVSTSHIAAQTRDAVNALFEVCSRRVLRFLGSDQYEDMAE